MDKVSLPLSIGDITLSDGRTVKSFLCSENATVDSEEIEKFI